LFVAEIFNTCHGLPPLEAPPVEEDEGTQEERMYRLWINSLGIDGVNVNDLYEEVKDGILLCKVVDKLQDGSINWKSVADPPRQNFDRNGNNGVAIKAMKDSLKFKMIGIGNADLTKGDKKLVLATVYQLCRFSYLKMIDNKSDKEIIAWANETVGDKVAHIGDFKDKSLCTGVYLCHLCAGIEPRSVKFEYVTDGVSEEDAKANALYVISTARKLGCIIFCVWENIVEVNPKQMLIFFAALMDAQKRIASGGD